MSIIDSFNALPGDQKMMIGGAVVGVGVIGYIAFKKNSTSSTASSSTSQPQPAMAGTSTLNGPEDVDVTVQETDTDEDEDMHHKRHLPPVNNKLKPLPFAQKKDDDDDDDDDKEKHKHHKHHHHKGHGGHSGGAWNSYIPHGRFMHPLHSAVMSSRRPVTANIVEQ